MTPAARALAQAYTRYRKSCVNADKLVAAEVARVRQALKTHADEVRKAVAEANRSAPPPLVVGGVKIRIRYKLTWTSWYRVNGRFMSKAGLITTFLVAGQSYDTKRQAVVAAKMIADQRREREHQKQQLRLELAREEQQRRVSQARLRAATAGLPAPQAAAIQALITQVMRR